MAGWYKLDETDALNLAEIQNTFNDRRSRHKRLRMLNFVWSTINGKGRPCPYFSVGYRTIASVCDVSEGTARRFIESLEDLGWVVRVGGGRSGKAPRRTFWWIAERAGIETTAHKFVQTTEYNFVQTPEYKREPVCTHPEPKTPPVCTDPSVVNPPTLYSLQSTKYSEGAVGYVHSASAENCPLYSCATDEQPGAERAARTHTEEALAWYRENGLPDPPAVPPMPDGGD